MQNRHLYPIASILMSMLVFLLPISKALSSIITALLLIYVLVDFILSENKKLNLLLLIGFGCYFLLSVASLLYTDNMNIGWNKVLLKLPLVFVPLIAFTISKETKKWEINFEIIYVAVITFIAFLSSLNYFAHKAELDFMVLQNKPIPVLCDIYHIEFSVLLALAILICCYRIVFYLWSGAALQYVYLVCAILGFAALHLMSVRTGMLSLYAGLMVLMFSYIIKTKKYWILISGFIGMVLLLGLTYKLSESFRNRIALTLDDVNVLQTDRDRNWHSVSMRVDAFTNGVAIFKEHTVLGVGIGDVDTAVQASFIKNESKLQYVNRKKPHHQFLENGLQSGVLSPILLLFILMLPIFISKNSNPMAICFVVVCLVAMQFESILERQSTLVVFCLLYAHFWTLPVRNNY